MFNKSKVIVDEKKIDEILDRGTEDIFIKEHLKEALLSGKKLRIKLGIDPTSPNIHLGRAVALRKLKAFQDLGHQVVLIIGDFTAKIADPSDKLEKRPMLTDEQIQENLKHYLKQIGKIINLNKTEVRYNSEWLKSMDFLKTAQLLDCFTVQQMSKRRNFSERLEKNQDVFVVEFMYPALQGYDSVKVEADVEIGGFDQLFNLKAGRTIQKKFGQKEQDIMTLSMLPGTDGRKMSSSWDNVISLLDTPEDMFGKVMSVRDDLILEYFKLCTDLPMGEISKIEEEMKSGINPRDLKIRLAEEITKLYHSEQVAKIAKNAFENTFGKKEFPKDAKVIESRAEDKLINILNNQGIVESKSEFRRLIEAGAVSDFPDKKIINLDEEVGQAARRIKIGKKTFVIIKPK
ncbi:MAG: tyrosine--tRNA ligase [Candidatus Zambryskibacteria bacterium]|nr:tyrosine--tRNA ligase [Candidatus Zambryskibacteria bacterium]